MELGSGPGSRLAGALMDTPFGREGSEGAKGSQGSEGVVGAFENKGAPLIIKPYNRPEGRGKRGPPLVAGATTFPPLKRWDNNPCLL